MCGSHLFLVNYCLVWFLSAPFYALSWFSSTVTDGKWLASVGRGNSGRRRQMGCVGGMGWLIFSCVGFWCRNVKDPKRKPFIKPVSHFSLGKISFEDPLTWLPLSYLTKFSVSSASIWSDLFLFHRMWILISHSLDKANCPKQFLESLRYFFVLLFGFTSTWGFSVVFLLFWWVPKLQK